MAKRERTVRSEQIVTKIVQQEKHLVWNGAPAATGYLGALQRNFAAARASGPADTPSTKSFVLNTMNVAENVGTSDTDSVAWEPEAIASLVKVLGDPAANKKVADFFQEVERIKADLVNQYGDEVPIFAVQDAARREGPKPFTVYECHIVTTTVRRQAFPNAKQGEDGMYSLSTKSPKFYRFEEMTQALIDDTKPTVTQVSAKPRDLRKNTTLLKAVRNDNGTITFLMPTDESGNLRLNGKAGKRTKRYTT